MAGKSLYAGEKNDRLKLLNGDQLTGEVKKLEDGLLVLSTDDMGTLSIEWDKIFSIISTKQFEVELSGGALYYGSLSDTSIPRYMVVSNDSFSIWVYRDEVVKLLQMDEGFWTSLDGSASLGFNYTKASNLFQLNGDMDVLYRGRKNQSQLTVSTVLTRQTDVENSDRFDLNFSESFLFYDRWFSTASFGLQSNDALGLDWRASVEGTGGRLLVHTNAQNLSLSAGLSGNREWLTSGEDSYNVEVVGTIAHSKFRYDRPKLNLNTKFSIYSNVRSPKKVRLEFNTSVSWEIFADFILKLSLYDSFNSEPPPDASRNDWNTVLSFGYTF